MVSDKGLVLITRGEHIQVNTKDETNNKVPN